jgi:nucleoside-diphosphate-sugar epimerase
MKIILTDSLGNVSKPLAEALAQQGHHVTVISQRPDQQATVAALSAISAIGSVTNADLLTNAFAGADAVYCMVPPNFTAPDSRACYRSVGGPYAQAVQVAEVCRVVHLSTGGPTYPTGRASLLARMTWMGCWTSCPA